MRHGVDMLAVGLLKFGPSSIHFFTDGWGDDDLLHPPDLGDRTVDPIDITWLTERVDGDLNVAHGVFQSPLENLPRRAAQGSVLAIGPVRDSGRTVVLMPAWNEHDPKVRVALARRLATRQVRSIILENAYFGSRQPDTSGDHPIRTVADFMLMGSSAVVEARDILAALDRDGHEIGVAGYSMGGNTAAIVSATVPFGLATAPMAASHSPSPVFLDGVLRNGISWDSLGGEQQADRLREVLGQISALRIEPAPHHSAAVIVGARTDAYIPQSATEALADHWPGSELRWLPGGHATLIWYRKDALADIIVESFDRYARLVEGGTQRGLDPSLPTTC